MYCPHAGGGRPDRPQGPEVARTTELGGAMGCCCSTPPGAAIDGDTAPTSPKQQKRLQKQQLFSDMTSDAFSENGLQPKVKGRSRLRKRNAVDGTAVVDVDVDDEYDLDGIELQAVGASVFDRRALSSCTDDPAAATNGGGCELNEAAVEAARLAEVEAARLAEVEAEQARLAAEAEAEAAAAAKVKAEAEARAAAVAAAKAKAEEEAKARLNSQLASRIATSASRETNASRLQKAAALKVTPIGESGWQGTQMADHRAAFDAFVRWEDKVQLAATALLGRAEKIKLSKKEKKKGTDASIFTLLAVEEQTRNSSFVASMQSRSLAKTAQSKALRAYGMLCDTILNKLMLRLPTMSSETAPLVSSYLSAVSQHRDLAKAARPDGLLS